MRFRYPEDFWVCVVFLLVAMAVGVILRVASAHSHPGDAAMDGWYRTLMAPDGTSCCNLRDCSPVDARIADGGWQAKIGEAWLSVPPEAVLRRENMDGRPIACVIGGTVKCFVEPAGA